MLVTFIKNKLFFLNLITAPKTLNELNFNQIHVFLHDFILFNILILIHAQLIKSDYIVSSGHFILVY